MDHVELRDATASAASRTVGRPVEEAIDSNGRVTHLLSVHRRFEIGLGDFPCRLLMIRGAYVVEEGVRLGRLP